jgi:hypothetical protein
MNRISKFFPPQVGHVMFFPEKTISLSCFPVGSKTTTNCGQIPERRPFMDRVGGLTDSIGTVHCHPKISISTNIVNFTLCHLWSENLLHNHTIRLPFSPTEIDEQSSIGDRPRLEVEIKSKGFLAHGIIQIHFHFSANRRDPDNVAEPTNFVVRTPFYSISTYQTRGHLVQSSIRIIPPETAFWFPIAFRNFG